MQSLYGDVSSIANLFYDLQEWHGEVSKIASVLSITSWHHDLFKREGISVLHAFNFMYYL
jgi:hypothetical protein